MDPHADEPVIDMMEEQKKITTKGGTMRLGSYPCDIKQGSLAYKIYERSSISERHRHRYEFNNKYLEQYESSGMLASGRNPETGLVEIMEIVDHPFFIGCQYHPELKSTVESPHPLFVHFVGAAKQFNDQRATAKNPLLQSEMI
jgi:CTP synthase